MAFSEVTDDIEIQAPPPGAAYSFEAGADVTAGQVVKLTSDDTVQPSGTDGEEVIGVATQTVSSGDMVMVLGNGARVRLTAGAAISAQDELTSHGATGNSGEVATASDGSVDFTNETLSKGDYVLGNAHESASSGDTFVATIDLSGFRPASS